MKDTTTEAVSLKGFLEIYEHWENGNELSDRQRTLAENYVQDKRSTPNVAHTKEEIDKIAEVAQSMGLEVQ